MQENNDDNSNVWRIKLNSRTDIEIHASFGGIYTAISEYQGHADLIIDSVFNNFDNLKKFIWIDQRDFAERREGFSSEEKKLIDEKIKSCLLNHLLNNPQTLQFFTTTQRNLQHLLEVFPEDKCPLIDKFSALDSLPEWILEKKFAWLKTEREPLNLFIPYNFNYVENHLSSFIIYLKIKLMERSEAIEYKIGNTPISKNDYIEGLERVLKDKDPEFYKKMCEHMLNSTAILQPKKNQNKFYNENNSPTLFRFKNNPAVIHIIFTDSIKRAHFLSKLVINEFVFSRKNTIPKTECVYNYAHLDLDLDLEIRIYEYFFNKSAKKDITLIQQQYKNEKIYVCSESLFIEKAKLTGNNADINGLKDENNTRYVQSVDQLTEVLKEDFPTAPLKPEVNISPSIPKLRSLIRNNDL